MQINGIGEGVIEKESGKKQSSCEKYDFYEVPIPPCLFNNKGKVFLKIVNPILSSPHVSLCKFYPSLHIINCFKTVLNLL